MVRDQAEWALVRKSVELRDWKDARVKSATSETRRSDI